MEDKKGQYLEHITDVCRNYLQTCDLWRGRVRAPDLLQTCDLWRGRTTHTLFFAYPKYIEFSSLQRF